MNIIESTAEEATALGGSQSWGAPPPEPEGLKTKRRRRWEEEWEEEEEEEEEEEIKNMSPLTTPLSHPGRWVGEREDKGGVWF
jgi:hypothetical protein